MSRASNMKRPPLMLFIAACHSAALQNPKLLCKLRVVGNLPIHRFEEGVAHPKHLAGSTVALVSLTRCSDPAASSSFMTSA